MNNTLAIYVIFDHPSDYPNAYVMKRDLIGTGKGEPFRDPAFEMVTPDLEVLRSFCKRMGLVKLMRHQDDDPVILETWI